MARGDGVVFSKQGDEGAHKLIMINQFIRIASQRLPFSAEIARSSISFSSASSSSADFIFHLSRLLHKQQQQQQSHWAAEFELEREPQQTNVNKWLASAANNLKLSSARLADSVGVVDVVVAVAAMRHWQ